MKFISLFAGVGGFDLGFEQAGHTCIGQVEIDKKSQKVLRTQFPNVPKWNDVTTAKEWADEQGFVGTTDIVCGGFPCQDVSVAGKRAGLAGERSGLFWDTLEFAKHVKAKYLILENVPGLLSSNEGRDFGTVITEMANSGYSHIEWRVLDSQFFGVPQRRRRLFIIGYTGDRSESPIFIEPQGIAGDIGKINQTQQTATPESNSSPKTSSVEVFVKGRRARSTKDFETWVQSKVSPTLNVFDVGDIRTTTIVVDKLPRRLTPIEFERLQGFPDNWTSSCTDSQRYKQMGNAVTVNVAKWIGERI